MSEFSACVRGAGCPDYPFTFISLLVYNRDMDAMYRLGAIHEQAMVCAAEIRYVISLSIAQESTGLVETPCK